jgi:thymidine phosphorylase
VIIGVERPLDFDSDGQLVASVLSKKVAAGSTHVVIDIPIGPTAKVRSLQAAETIEGLLAAVGADLGVTVRVVRSDGSQPVGRGIGPALEARDVLSVLRGDASAPADLRDRSLVLAGEVIEMGGAAPAGEGRARACEILASGAALAKFEAICRAQGGMREPRRAPLTHVVRATHHGRLSGFDNRRLAKIAKLAGAPRAAAAGIEVHRKVGAEVAHDEPLLTIHAETPGELDYARSYLALNPQIIDLEDV